MSIEAMKWAFEQENVRPGPRFVLVALANRANDEGGDLYPSLRWIKKKTGIPERTIRQYITDLMRLGLIIKTERTREDGGRTSNEYRLPLTQPGLRFDTPQAATAGGGDAVAGGWAALAEPPRQPLPHPPASTAGRETKDKTKEKIKEPAAARRTSMPDGFAVSDRVREWAVKNNFAQNLDLHFEHFVGHVRANRGRYADWDEALMNCIRADWGGVRKQAQIAGRLGQAIGAPSPTDWWKSADGVRGKAAELKVEDDYRPEWTPAENHAWLRARVCAKAGDGPWCEDRSDTFQRLLRTAREKLRVAA